MSVSSSLQKRLPRSLTGKPCWKSTFTTSRLLFSRIIQSSYHSFPSSPWWPIHSSGGRSSEPQSGTRNTGNRFESVGTAPVLSQPPSTHNFGPFQDHQILLETVTALQWPLGSSKHHHSNTLKIARVAPETLGTDFESVGTAPVLSQPPSTHNFGPFKDHQILRKEITLTAFHSKIVPWNTWKIVSTLSSISCTHTWWFFCTQFLQ